MLLFNSTWAQPVNHTSSNSISEAINGHTPTNTNQGHEAKNLVSSYTHDSEKYNSLFRGALAIQGVRANLVINSNSKIDYERHKTSGEHNESLFRGALSK
jgi:hypothetical protein